MADKGITRANLSPELLAELDNIVGGQCIIPQNSPPTTIQFGGIAPGTDLSGKTVVETLLLATNPYQKPEITQFSTTKTLYEAGTTITSIDLTIKVTKKSDAITNISLYDGSTLVTTFSNVSNGGTFTYTYRSTINANKTLKVTATDGKETVSKQLAISFINPMYVGTVNGTINKVLQAKGTYTFSNITCTNDQVVFKYDASYGNLASIKDSNNFENIGAFTKTTEVISGVTYNVYTSGSATLSNFK